MKNYKEHTACIRVDDANPNHHLYRNNGGNWWIHYRTYPTAITADRRRQSLHTKCLTLARQRRDEIFTRLFRAYEEGI